MHHAYVEPEHLLLGLISESEGFAGEILRGLGLDYNHVRNEILKRTPAQFVIHEKKTIPYSKKSKRVIESALEEATKRDVFPCTEHILLGLFEEHDSIAAQILLNAGLNFQIVEEAIHRQYKTIV